MEVEAPTDDGATKSGTSRPLGNVTRFDAAAYKSIVADATLVTLRYLIESLPSYRPTWQCLMCGRYHCWSPGGTCDSVALDAEIARGVELGNRVGGEGARASGDLPGTWMQLVRARKQHGEAIFEFIRRDRT